MIKYILFILIPLNLCNNNIRNLDNSLTLDNTKWSYDSTNGVYYQVGVSYCKNPASTSHNILGIYIPKNYFSCSLTTSSSNLYTCSINASGKVGNYIATNAPIVMPINTAGYSAQTGPTTYSYNGLSDYLSAGLIYVYAGCRGRHEGESYNSGAPWGVTDLKAAIRFIKYNSDLIPGDINSIFSFGHSGGGAQSCLLGITGDSNLYTNYLNNIGAAMTDKKGNNISDSIKGSQCWCPITNLDTADMAYEWNMGQYFTTNTRASGTFTKKLSEDLTSSYITYINQLRLKDENGNILSLSTTEVNSGSYYNYLKSVIQTSLNNFLEDTTFPYTPSSTQQADGGFSGGGSGPSPDGPPPNEGEVSGESPPNNGELPGGNRILSVTYETVSNYIDELNSEENWVTYDSSSNKASITNIGAFVKKCKNPTKDVGAFDSLSKSQAENKLFGISSTIKSAHFDKYISELLMNNDDTYKTLTNYNEDYKNSYSSDISSLKDALDNSIEYRSNMYNPMYYISPLYDGYKSSKVASYFRINTGITQGDTSNCVEMNLALALKNYGKNVEFTTVWEQGHTTAERKGSSQSTSNFISWINTCMGVSNNDNINTGNNDNQNADIANENTDKSNNNTNKAYYIDISLKYISLVLFLLF